MGCSGSASTAGAGGGQSGQDAQKVQELIDANPVMVFSKSYCPFCHKTKDLLKRSQIAYKAIELDNEPNGKALQDYLTKKTGQRTVPNVFVGKKHVGGNDDM